MINLERLKDLRKVSKREIELRFSEIPEYIERMKITYEFCMDNEWQVRKELMNPDRIETDKEFPKKYIEYLLSRGGEYKTFYINIDKGLNRMDLIDGRRRIQAILGYLNNEIEVYGSYYRDFSERDKEEIDRDIIFKISISEIRSKVEILRYYNELNFYRENEIQNNMILMSSLPVVNKGITVIEAGTGREIEYWEYSGSVIESVPIPIWIRDRMIESGEVYFRDNHWIDRKSKREIAKGYYLRDDNRIRIVREEDIFNKYYLKK